MVYAIKSSVGLVGFLRDVITDNEIRDIILNISLPEFSKYYHNFLKVSNVNIRQLKRVDGFGENSMAFKLPNKIMDVVNDADVRILGFKYNVNQTFSSHIGMNNPMRYNTHRPLRDHIPMMYYHEGKRNYASPMIPRFKEPDVIYYDTNEWWADMTFVDIIAKTEHPRNLSTINETARPLFQELATLDIMVHLHQNKLKYLNIDNSVSRVELELDRFLNAHEDRKELILKLEELKDNENFAVIAYS